MAAPQLSAKYRIDFLLDDAFKALRQLKAGIAEIQGPAAPADALNKSLDQAEARVKKVTAAQKQGAKEATTEQNTAAKAAADEALRIKRAQLAEEKRLAKEAADAERAAKRTLRDEERRLAREAADAQRAAQKKANFEAYQARALAPQLTDIGVGLATGQSPLMVALQQGGQLKDIYGGVGNALKALASVFTVTRVLAGGLATALVGVATAAVQGYRESDTLNKSLALTGNVANVTAASLDRSAKQIADRQRVSIASVREALMGAVDTGTFIGPTLDSAGRAAVALSKLTGKAAADQIKDFEGMGNGVAEWAAKQNKAYNFLTVEEYKHIRSLEAAGREQEAMREVLDKLSATMEQRAVPAVGLLEKLWNGVKKAVSDAGEELRKIGRDTTPEDAIAKLQEQLARVRSRNFGYNPANPASVRQADAEEAALTTQLTALQAQRNRDLLRKSEAAIDMKVVNTLIAEQEKSFQDQLAQLEQAGGKRRLAITLAALDSRQAIADRANARGLVSATQYSLELNAIEQQRAQAQLQQLQRQIDLEGKRVSGKPGDEKAKQARLIELDAQQIELQSRLRQLSAQGRGIVDAKALEDARSDAEKWAQAWQTAASQVRAFTDQNAEAAASRLGDPIARADAEAASKVSAAKRQLADLVSATELRISLTIDPAQKQELQRQLDELQRQGPIAIADQTDMAKFVSLRNSWGLATDALRTKERELDLAVQQGAITAEEAETRKFALRDKALAQLQLLLDALRKLAKTDEERGAIDNLQQSIGALTDRTTDLQGAVKDSLKGEFASFFSDVATGAKSAGDAFKDFIVGVARSALNVIGQRLGDQLANSLMPKDGSASGGWLSTAANFVTGLFQHHDGGVIGSGGTPRSIGLASIAAAMAAGLPYYHQGGISGAMGLRSNEELAVLEKGEEVLTADDPRHVRNLRSSIGSLVISTKIEGAQGSEADLTGAGDRLNQVVQAAISNWAAEESREGGILARGRS